MDQQKEEIVSSEAPQGTEITEMEEDNFDTDLEDELSDGAKGRPSVTDGYLYACRRIGTAPVQSFLRNLGQSSFNLNDYGLGPRGAKALAFALQYDNSLTNLELEHNYLGLEGVHYMMEMLQENSTISSLNLSNNKIGAEGASVISQMISSNYNVKSLKLSGNGFDDTSAKHFADALKGDYVIRELDLSHNKFSDDGGVCLGEIFAVNEGLEVLNLSWNRLSRKGGMALCEGLQANMTLKHLLLAGNELNAAANSFSRLLKENNTLVLLDLSGNRMDDQAVRELGAALAVNTNLKTLKLFNNPITRDGALTLLQAIKSNPTSALETVDISTVVVCEAFVELLEDIHRSSPALEVRYHVPPHILKRLSAVSVFKSLISEKSLIKSFLALDKDGSQRISTADFRKILKDEAPLNHNQIVWLVKKFDRRCTGFIDYSQFYSE